MADPTKAQLACNAEFSFEDPGTPGTFIIVPELVSIGDIGSTGQFVDVTRLDSPDCTMEFISGMNEGAEKSLVFHKIPADVGQDAFIAEATAKNTVLARIDFPFPDIRFEFSMALSGYSIQAPEPNAALDFMISGKETGALVETTPIPPP